MKRTKSHSCIFGAPHQINWSADNDVFGGSASPSMRSLFFNNLIAGTRLIFCYGALQQWRKTINKQAPTNNAINGGLLFSKQTFRAHCVNALWKHRILTLFRFFSRLTAMTANTNISVSNKRLHVFDRQQFVYTAAVYWMEYGKITAYTDSRYGCVSTM